MTTTSYDPMTAIPYDPNDNPDDIIVVNVRWNDGYLEEFKCLEVRQGGQILWMRLINGQNRTIPFYGNVRWFSTDPESHAKIRKEK